MKKLIAILACLVTSVSFATTYVPVQLLNPTGSSSGQVITSTGASSAPGWQTIPWASPPAIGGTTAAAGSFTTLSATGLITPSTTNGIKGTTAADSANAGSVGELIQSQVTTNTAWAPATGVSGNLTSISLTAGDWEVSGNVFWAAAAGSGLWTSTLAGISTTSATTPANYLLSQTGQTTAAATNVGYTVPTQRINVSTTTTVYLTGNVGYTSGSMNFQCQLRARRVR